MNFEEHAAKSLVLTPAGIPVPRGTLCISAAEAAMAAANIGPCVVKAQVPAGKRGKAGGIKLAAGPDEAKQAASEILGMRIGDYHGRARPGRGAGRNCARVLCRRPARRCRAQAADPFLHGRRHGHRGNRRGKTVGDPASPGRHRWQAVGRRPCGHARWSPSRRGARADRAHSRSHVCRLPRARCRAS